MKNTCFPCKQLRKCIKIYIKSTDFYTKSTEIYIKCINIIKLVNIYKISVNYV